MSDSFAPISASTDDKYFVRISAVTNLLTVMVFGNASKSLITKFEVTPDTAMAFEEAVEDIFDEKCKAIIWDIFKFKPVGYSHVIKFAYEIRIKLIDKKIYTCFYSEQSLFTSELLITAKIKSTKNDTFLCIRALDYRISLAEYIFTDDGYKPIREEFIGIIDDESALDLREKILKGTKPKHIIVYSRYAKLPTVNKLKDNVFTHEKIHYLDKSFFDEPILQTIKIAKYVRDRKIIKYHVIQKCTKDFGVYFENSDEPLFIAQVGETLPISKKEYALRNAIDMDVCGFDDVTVEKRLIYTSHMKEEDCQQRHRSKLVFYVDSEGFPYVRNIALILDIIQELPTKLDSELKKKIPVITFCDNYSVICAVKKGDNHYNFLDGWNDLIEMMSIGNLYEVDDPVFKDSDKLDVREDILCFYMVKFIEEHLKVIRDEISKKVDEIAIWPVLSDDALFKERLLLCFKKIKDINFHFLLFDLPK
uniref:Uncharacterized protein n=1 Tax=Panagrolaimus sp. PS1159 TaxID=55785 RepID=A0AC35EY71_9BILA